MIRCFLAASVLILANQSCAAPPGLHHAIQSHAPILWYQFNESSGPVQNHGTLGAGYDAIAFGTVERDVGTGFSDTAMGFNELGYLESLGSSPLTGNPTMTIETLVRLSAGGSAHFWGPFLHWGEGGTGREVYFGIQNARNDRLYAGFYNAGARTVNTVPTNRWLHVVWTRVGGNDSLNGTSLYVNGTPVPVEQDFDLSPGFLPAGSINVTSTRFRVNAGRDFPGSRYFTGALDELALYDRVLTPQEIEEHARKAIGPFPFQRK
ncbi:MAG: LamG domain-containing protein [Phycisphaeraceae bacterium]|nr:LamG domain-containing protein [Phycisphaeraceae bacterium]